MLTSMVRAGAFTSGPSIVGLLKEPISNASTAWAGRMVGVAEASAEPLCETYFPAARLPRSRWKLPSSAATSSRIAASLVRKSGIGVGRAEPAWRSGAVAELLEVLVQRRELRPVDRLLVSFQRVHLALGIEGDLGGVVVVGIGGIVDPDVVDPFAEVPVARLGANQFRLIARVLIEVHPGQPAEADLPERAVVAFDRDRDIAGSGELIAPSHELIPGRLILVGFGEFLRLGQNAGLLKRGLVVEPEHLHGFEIERVDLAGDRIGHVLDCGRIHRVAPGGLGVGIDLIEIGGHIDEALVLDQIGDDVAVDDGDFGRSGSELRPDEFLVAIGWFELDANLDAGVQRFVAIGQRLIGLGIGALHGDDDRAAQGAGRAASGRSGDLDQATLFRS